jgi:hypothetical protein
LTGRRKTRPCLLERFGEAALGPEKQADKQENRTTQIREKREPDRKREVDFENASWLGVAALDRRLIHGFADCCCPAWYSAQITAASSLSCSTGRPFLSESCPMGLCGSSPKGQDGAGGDPSVPPVQAQPTLTFARIPVGGLALVPPTTTGFQTAISGGCLLGLRGSVIVLPKGVESLSFERVEAEGLMTGRGPLSAVFRASVPGGGSLVALQDSIIFVAEPWSYPQSPGVTFQRLAVEGIAAAPPITAGFRAQAPGGWILALGNYAAFVPDASGAWASSSPSLSFQRVGLQGLITSEGPCSGGFRCEVPGGWLFSVRDSVTFLPDAARAWADPTLAFERVAQGPGAGQGAVLRRLPLALPGGLGPGRAQQRQLRTRCEPCLGRGQLAGLGYLECQLRGQVLQDCQAFEYAWLAVYSGAGCSS